MGKTVKFEPQGFLALEERVAALEALHKPQMKYEASLDARSRPEHYRPPMRVTNYHSLKPHDTVLLEGRGKPLQATVLYNYQHENCIVLGTDKNSASLGSGKYSASMHYEFLDLFHVYLVQK